MAIDDDEPRGKVTKDDFKKTLQVYAKAIELQILNSQQQEKILENLDRLYTLLVKVEGHFSNGFRSEIKEHVHQEVQEIKREIERCIGEHSKSQQDHWEVVDAFMKDTGEKINELHGSSWKQWWLFGGIALFSIVNAILTIVALWANGFILGSGGK